MYINANEKIDKYFEFVIELLAGLKFTAWGGFLVIPFIGSEKNIFVEIGFPLDYQNNGMAFWIANTFHYTLVFDHSLFSKIRI